MTIQRATRADGTPPIDRTPGAGLAVAAVLAAHGAGCSGHFAAAASTDSGPPAVCTDGAVETMICDPLGAQSRRCALGQWGDYGACDAPPFLVIPVPGPIDVVHDAKRHRLYITSSDLDGLVLSYDLTTRRFDPPLLSGEAFQGIDLSPDGDKLVVADGTTDPGHSWIYRIDLTTRATQELSFARPAGELGTTWAVFTTDVEALVTSDSNSSGQLRRVDLTTGTAVGLRATSGSAGLAASADHAVIGFIEHGSPHGLWGRYEVADQTIATSQVDAFVPRIAVDRTGSQFAIPRQPDVLIFDGKLRLRAAIGAPSSTTAVGAAYSAVADELYVAWSGPGTSIDAWNSITLDKLRDIVPAAGLFPDTLFPQGILRVSRDGRLVFAVTGAGIGVYRTTP